MNHEQELALTCREEFVDDAITKSVIGAAIKVHRALGPGLLESAYQHCLAHELSTNGFDVRREVPVPVRYDGVQLECGYRIDILVNNQVIVEVKAVEAIAPIHTAQLLTYLRLANIPRGLILNFHVQLLRDGIRRCVLSRPSEDRINLSSTSSSANSAPLR